MRKILLAAMALLLTACVTGEKVRASVTEGMTKAEVIELIGKPDGFKREGNSEAMQYTNRLISGWSWDRTDYTVILVDGRVTEYGPGQVRQAQTGAFFIYHMR